MMFLQPGEMVQSWIINELWFPGFLVYGKYIEHFLLETLDAWLQPRKLTGATTHICHLLLDIYASSQSQKPLTVLYVMELTFGFQCMTKTL